MFCSQCGKENTKGAKFCTSCGAVLSSETIQQTTPPEYQSVGRRGSHGPSGQHMKIRRFPCSPENSHVLISDLINWLTGQNFNCQQLTTEDGGTLLQVSKKGGWRKIVGMSTALNVVFHQSVNNITVEIGAGRWLDKAAVGAVGALLVFPPLAVAAGFGAWLQIKLPNKIYQYISEKCNHS